MSHRLLIVSTSPDGRVATRIKDIASAAGLVVRIYSLSAIMLLQDEDVQGAIVLPRIAPEYNREALPILTMLEKKGARLINETSSWDVSRDKWKSYQVFQSQGVATPLSFLYPDTSYQQCVDRLGSPFLFKPVDGTHGEGIIIVRNEDDLRGKVGIVQQYVHESSGTDIRAFVIGGAVVGAMQRVAHEGDFRANLHQGATATVITLDEESVQLAIRAAQALHLMVAGVDIVISPQGPLVLEANPSPGLGIERYVGPTIVPAMIDAITHINS